MNEPAARPAVSSGARIVLAALSLWVGTGIAFFVVTVLAAALSGKTVAGGERAVVGAGVAYLLVVVATTLMLVRLSRGASALARWLGTGVFLLLQLATALAMLFVTIVLLNR